jgi:hypothetical protein
MRLGPAPLGGKASPELVLSQQTFPSVAPTAGGQDVLDEVRAASSQRHAVVRFERTIRPAVSAAMSVRLQKRDPLLGGVVAICGELTTSSSRTDRLSQFPVGAYVRREIGRETLPVPSVVVAALGVVFVRMPLPPTSHRVAGFLRITSDPVAAVLASTVRIFVGHATDLAGKRGRGNRTQKKWRGLYSRATVAGKGFEPLAFGL